MVGRGTVLTVVLAVAVAWQTTAQPALTATALLKPRSGRIGDRFTLLLTVEGPADVAGVSPVIGSAIGPFEVVEVTPPTSLKPSAHAPVTWTVALVTFEHGPLHVPPIVVEGHDSHGTLFRVATTPVPVEIGDPAWTAEEPLRPLTTVLDARSGRAPGVLSRARWFLLLLGGGLATRVLCRRLRPWRHRRVFWRRLVAEALVLKASGASMPVRDQYMRAARLLRQGVAPVADRHVEPLTSPELVALVGLAGPVGVEIGPALSLLLAHLDAVRFGGAQPSHETRRRASEAVVTLLHALSAIAARRSGSAS